MLFEKHKFSVHTKLAPRPQEGTTIERSEEARAADEDIIDFISHEWAFLLVGNSGFGGIAQNLASLRGIKSARSTFQWTNYEAKGEEPHVEEYYITGPWPHNMIWFNGKERATDGFYVVDESSGSRQSEEPLSSSEVATYLKLSDVVNAIITPSTVSDKLSPTHSTDASRIWASDPIRSDPISIRKQPTRPDPIRRNSWHASGSLCGVTIFMACAWLCRSKNVYGM